MVGQEPLKLLILVRFQVPQQIFEENSLREGSVGHFRLGIEDLLSEKWEGTHFARLIESFCIQKIQ